MHRRKKQLLGLVGLALVAIMTVVACMIPAPGAAAVEEQSSSVGLTVRVQSDGEVPTVDIVSLDMDDIVVRKSFKVRISYSKVRKDTGLQVYLKDNGAVTERGEVPGRAAQAGEVELPLGSCEITYSKELQYCDVEYTLDAELSPEQRVWSYTTRAEVISPNGSTAEDVVDFFYQSAHIVFNGEFNQTNKNPIVEVMLNPDVNLIMIQVTDKDGNKVFVSGSDDKPLAFTREDLVKMGLDADGKVKIELPFDEYKAKNGTYTASLMAYGDPDDLENTLLAMSIAKTKIEYKIGGSHPVDPEKPDEPNKPEVPDTGFNLFQNLNISSADYIITGLVAFGMVTAFAVFLIVRRNKR